MAKGKLNLQAADGAVIGLVVPDGLASGERQIALGANLSGITAYHLLQGNLAVSNSTITKGFDTKLFTRTSAGNLVVDTGIDMNTQWGNTAEERFGGLVWVKDRVTAGAGHVLQDTIRGAGYYLQTNNTAVNTYLSNTLVSFNSNGFTYGDNLALNVGQVGWNFQTTHRVSGTTNHGKAYTCHYNPFTGFTIVRYEGSGIAGHEIPHHLGRKLGFNNIKCLTNGTEYWQTGISDKGHSINSVNAFVDYTGTWDFTDNAVTIKQAGIAINASTNQYIMYGWANSYFDESNKLIGNYELVTYQGTGAAGNKVKTKGKPAWVMIKRLDSTGNWWVFDNKRTNDGYVLHPNLANAEYTATDLCDFASDGIILKDTNADGNASGGQYIALVAYDTNANGGGSYYPLASDTANLQINNALIPLAQGIDSNGAKNTILSKNETITGLTYTAGKNYVYCDKNGAYGVTPYKPRYLESELVRIYAGESPEYYDVVKNKWFSTSGQSELVTNGTFDSNTTGWVADGSNILSISNGTMLVNRNNSTANGAKQTIPTTIGKKYNIRFKVTSLANSGTPLLYIGSIANGSELGTYVNTTTGTFEYSFIAQSTSTYLQFGVTTSATGIVGYDDISVFATDIVPTTEITESRNYLNHIVYADNDGGVLYVEELPKIEYKDIVKANEYRGKNACTMWAILDCTTTPITIKDSYNVAYVIRVGTGDIEIMPLDLDISKVTVIPGGHASENPAYTGLAFGAGVYSGKIRVTSRNYSNTQINLPELSINVYGGKN